MKKSRIGFLVILIIIGCLSTFSFASEQRVFDDAELFTSSEKEELESIISEYRATMSFDLVVVTTADANGKTEREYADDYYDDNNFGVGSDGSGALLLIDMDNREVYISTKGSAIDYINGSRINAILDDVFVYMPDENYFEAAKVFIIKCKEYEQEGVPKGQFQYDETTGKVTERYRTLTIKEIGMALILSLAIGSISVLGVKAKYKKRYDHIDYPFRNKSNLILNTERNTLVNQFVTTRIIEEPDQNNGGFSGGGGSATHSSSSGSTHGGGGRSF